MKYFNFEYFEDDLIYFVYSIYSTSSELVPEPYPYRTDLNQSFKSNMNIYSK